jgi:hypothetical protein
MTNYEYESGVLYQYDTESKTIRYSLSDRCKIVELRKLLALLIVRVMKTHDEDIMDFLEKEYNRVNDFFIDVNGEEIELVPISRMAFCCVPGGTKIWLNKCVPYDIWLGDLLEIIVYLYDNYYTVCEEDADRNEHPINKFITSMMNLDVEFGISDVFESSLYTK